MRTVSQIGAFDWLVYIVLHCPVLESFRQTHLPYLDSCRRGQALYKGIKGTRRTGIDADVHLSSLMWDVLDINPESLPLSSMWA